MSVNKIAHAPLGTLRINGHAVDHQQDHQQTPPVQGKTRPQGVALPLSHLLPPVEAPADPYATQEHFYDQAHLASIRGQEAARALSGQSKKPKKTAEKNRRIRAINSQQDTDDDTEDNRLFYPEDFADGDPAKKQQKFYKRAADFEESYQKKARLSKQPFSRRSAQVETGDALYVAVEQEDGGAVSGEREFISHETESDTLPNYALTHLTGETKPIFEDTNALRRILGLKDK